MPERIAPSDHQAARTASAAVGMASAAVGWPVTGDSSSWAVQRAVANLSMQGVGRLRVLSHILADKFHFVLRALALCYPEVFHVRERPPARRSSRVAAAAAAAGRY